MIHSAIIAEFTFFFYFMTNLTLYPASPRGISNWRFLLNKFSFNFIVALHIIHLSTLLLIFTSFFCSFFSFLFQSFLLLQITFSLYTHLLPFFHKLFWFFFLLLRSKHSCFGKEFINIWTFSFVNLEQVQFIFGSCNTYIEQASFFLFTISTILRTTKNIGS